MAGSRLERLLRDESGPTAVEYAMLLALILLAVIGAINSVGNMANNLWEYNAQGVEAASGGGAPAPAGGSPEPTSVP